MMYNLWSCLKDYNSLICLLEELEPNNKEVFEKSKERIKEVMENGQVTERNFGLAKDFIYWLTHSFSGDINGGMSKVNNHIGLLNRLKKGEIQRKLDIVEVYNKSYEDIIKEWDSKDTFFYVDPPYYGKEHFYGFHPFTVKDHERLAESLKRVEGKFLISYYEKPEIRDLYPEEIFD